MQDIHGSRGIECLYLNDKNPSGTLIFSNFINNKKYREKKLSTIPPEERKPRGRPKKL